MNICRCAVLLTACGISNVVWSADSGWLTYSGQSGPGVGKRIILISGDEEYRSEEAMPMLGQILAKHHGFHCTVVFALADDGTIDPNNDDVATIAEYVRAETAALDAQAGADLLTGVVRFGALPKRPTKEA